MALCARIQRAISARDMLSGVRELACRARPLATSIASTSEPARKGVAPPGFGGVRIGDRADVWIPRYVVPQLISPRARPSPGMLALARLKPGVTLADAASALAATHDPKIPGFAQAGSTATTLRIRRSVLTLHVAAMVVVLICAGLFVRTVTAGFSRNPGFDIDHTVFLATRLDAVSPANDRRPADVLDQEHRIARFLDTIRREPQVTSAEMAERPISLERRRPPGGFRSINRSM
jgi:hypothetical protein